MPGSMNYVPQKEKKKTKTLKRETIISEEKLYFVHYKFLVIRGTHKKRENKSIFYIFIVILLNSTGFFRVVNSKKEKYE